MGAVLFVQLAGWDTSIVVLKAVEATTIVDVRNNNVTSQPIGFEQIMQAWCMQATSPLQHVNTYSHDRNYC